MEVIFPTPIPEVFANKLVEVYNNIRPHVDEINAKAIYLFGSLARGDFNMLSDIDILIEVEGSILDSIEILSRYNVCSNISGPDVDLIVRSTEALNAPYIPFNEFVKKDRILLWKR